MPDREKVIKGLQEIVDDNWMKTHADWYVSVCSDALAMLKKQIPIAPIKGEHGKCPICGYKADHHYCANCGQALNWEE